MTVRFIFEGWGNCEERKKSSEHKARSCPVKRSFHVVESHQYWDQNAKHGHAGQAENVRVAHCVIILTVLWIRL